MKKTMLRQVMSAPYEIGFDQVPVPEPEPSQVLLQIKRIGICGSDIHVYHGLHPYVTYPLTQGHEVSAKIVGLGKEVDKFTIGQKVTIEPQIYCGECYPCTHGKYNLCESLKVMGFQDVGTASEYFAIDASKVTPLPVHVSYDEGALIEPLAVAVHACRQAGELKGKKVAVLGAGPIGILLCQSLKALGADKVMVTDISDYRLEIAKECGADYVYNTKKLDFSKVFIECFGEDKADIIYDCAGNDITMNQAIQNARKGSLIILVAVFEGMANIDLAKLNDSELDLNTSMMYRHEDYVDAIRILDEGKIKLKPLMSKSYSFLDFEKAYKYIDENKEKTMKVIIEVDSNED